MNISLCGDIGQQQARLLLADASAKINGWGEMMMGKSLREALDEAHIAQLRKAVEDAQRALDDYLKWEGRKTLK